MNLVYIAFIFLIKCVKVYGIYCLPLNAHMCVSCEDTVYNNTFIRNNYTSVNIESIEYSDTIIYQSVNTYDGCSDRCAITDNCNGMSITVIDGCTLYIKHGVLNLYTAYAHKVNVHSDHMTYICPDIYSNYYITFESSNSSIYSIVQSTNVNNDRLCKTDNGVPYPYIIVDVTQTDQYINGVMLNIQYNSLISGDINNNLKLTISIIVPCILFVSIVVIYIIIRIKARTK